MVERLTVHSRSLTTNKIRRLDSATEQITEAMMKIIVKIMEVGGTVQASSHSIFPEQSGIGIDYRASASIIFSVPEGTDVSRVR